MPVTTEVYKRLPATFDMCGKFLGYPLQIVAAEIKPGLVKRLVAHATRRMVEAGFPVTENVVVSKVDEDDYAVEFVNAKGGKITVQGILIGRGGWPCVDHRFAIEEP